MDGPNKVQTGLPPKWSSPGLWEMTTSTTQQKGLDCRVLPAPFSACGHPKDRAGHGVLTECVARAFCSSGSPKEPYECHASWEGYGSESAKPLSNRGKGDRTFGRLPFLFNWKLVRFHVCWKGHRLSTAAADYSRLPTKEKKHCCF